ncbi:protein kinase [Massilia sp. DWR3-1-1]|uniref:leucine-rich repeat domain-containing protein n=1 Tax=Massilia sp. DWR3-1-1 TaxID=2804559 RepID=UPI003CE801EE
MHTLEQLRDGSLAGAVRLRLSCGLTEFPPEIFDLADTLEILDLSGNALSRLPDALPRLTRLRILFCSSNDFTVLPAMLGACPQLTMIGFKSNRIKEVPATALPAALRWLILTDNRITALPASIGRCTQLQKLMLAGNELRALPEALAACTALELLRIAANALTTLPAWLLAMPRLAWLAYAGNPCSAADEAAARAGAQPAPIDWQQLQLAQRLGEGASGVIYQGQWRQAGSAAADAVRAVAVKLFKGAITSDGLPACELAACIGAGGHPHLIAVLGEVTGHPAGAQGLVMDLIDPAFHNLAGPPSMDSCTRDIYRPGQRFTLATLLRLAGAVAAAAAHLHSRGILHGDLYGHNILHTDDGEALLGDFGAASQFACQGAQAGALQRLEVRAFGVLLGELIERCEGAPGTDDVIEPLAQLRQDCVQDKAAARPLFEDIARRIAQADQAWQLRICSCR